MNKTRKTSAKGQSPSFNASAAYPTVDRCGGGHLAFSYTDIHADDEFKNRINTLIKHGKPAYITKRILKTAGVAAAGVAIVSVAVLNGFPSTAYALSDIPVISDIVRVFTFGRYSHSEAGFEADISTPKIEGLLDKELENKLNKEFKDNADALIAAYESDVEEFKKTFGEETIHLGITSDYTVRTDNADILAIDAYILTTAGSSSTVHSFYNIDKKSGTLITLDSLFKEGADYVGILSEYILAQMKYENENNDGLYWTEKNEIDDGFERIREDQNFFINNAGELVICFDKYEVAAGAQGCPEFAIPNEIIADIRK